MFVKLPADGWVPALPLVTPEMYGAAGDGSTDDTTALQAWLDEPDVLHWLPGNVYITDPLTVPASCRIDGTGTLRLRAASHGSSFAVLDAAGTSGNKLTGIVIAGITVDGNRANYPGSMNSNQEGIDFTHVDGAVIERVTVINSIADSIDLDESTRCRIVHCNVLNAGKAGIHLSGGAAENFVAFNHVDGAGARDTTRAAITQVNTGSRDNIFVGNRAENSNKGYEIAGSGGAVGVANVSAGNSSADTTTGATSWT